MSMPPRKLRIMKNIPGLKNRRNLRNATKLGINDRRERVHGHRTTSWRPKTQAKHRERILKFSRLLAGFILFLYMERKYTGFQRVIGAGTFVLKRIACVFSCLASWCLFPRMHFTGNAVIILALKFKNWFTVCRSFFTRFRPILPSSVSISGRGLQSKPPSEAGEHVNPNRLSSANRQIRKKFNLS